MLALVAPAIAKLQTFVTAKKNDPFVSPLQQFRAAQDILDRCGLTAQEEVVITARFDERRFATMSTAEIKQLVMLAKRASSLRDVTDVEAE
jgi:hypothetical protein